MLQYIEPVGGVELSCTVDLKSTYAFGNKDSPRSLDSTEEQLMNNMNCHFFFFKEEVVMKS